MAEEALLGMVLHSGPVVAAAAGPVVDTVLVGPELLSIAH
jgi:hypothetical protein